MDRLFRKLGASVLFGTSYRTFIVSSIALYLAAIVIIQPASQRDPSSLFFNPAKGYQPIYSEYRRAQAEAYITKVDTNTAGSIHRYDPSRREEALCVGIPTVARKNARYLRDTVGSLLQGLHRRERRNVFLILFVANSEPSKHPAFNEGWMQVVADQVLTYNSTQAYFEHILDMEEHDTEYREKPLFDYVHLLKACQEIGTPHIVMLEDDVIAMDGWYHRTRRAVEQADARPGPYLYLRLFLTEQFLGWNSEYALTYLGNSVVAFIVLAIALLGIRAYWPILKGILNNYVLLTICLFHLPLAILLMFAVGRNTIWPLSTGVVTMNNFGCCSQGFVFSSAVVPKLISWYEEKRIGFVDMLTEEYGDLTGMSRLAISPSVLQHTGSHTSKSEEDAKSLQDPHRKRTVAETIWNFEFETFRPSRLRRDHAKAVKRYVGWSQSGD